VDGRAGGDVYLPAVSAFDSGKAHHRNHGLATGLPLGAVQWDKPWSAATDVRSLFKLPTGTPLWAYQPDMRYHLLEERLYPRAEGDSKVGLLFELENSQTPAQMAAALERLGKLLPQQPRFAQLRRAFLVWVKHVLIQHKKLDLGSRDFNDLAEVQDMLATRLQQWEEDILQKGIEQGIEQGIEKGEYNLLQQLLEKRFGPLPDWATEKLAQANSQQLEQWGLKLLDAGRLEDVFE